MLLKSSDISPVLRILLIDNSFIFISFTIISFIIISFIITFGHTPAKFCEIGKLCWYSQHVNSFNRR
ncbi:hypothetical protein BD408DRAFT_408375 [Parasitella parasitica]|nr:hypothetical protein BD408DRAFT_408375 [Parasitella parasitica]